MNVNLWGNIEKGKPYTIKQTLNIIKFIMMLIMIYFGKKMDC
jgi:capsule polysaccharide export protein KpsE/RkpR